jgi:hypothetical protein
MARRKRASTPPSPSGAPSGSQCLVWPESEWEGLERSRRTKFAAHAKLIATKNVPRVDPVVVAPRTPVMTTTEARAYTSAFFPEVSLTVDRVL